MSHSQLGTKNYQMTEEGGQTLLPSQAEYYLNNLSDWRNIQDIIRLTFKTIVDIVKVQGKTIKDIEQSLLSKASKCELTTELNLKANGADIMRFFSDISSSLESKVSIDEMNTLLEGKISKSDLLYYLKAKPSTEEVRNMLEDKLDTSEYKSDHNELKHQIEAINKEISKRGQYDFSDELTKLQKKIDSKISLTDYEESQKAFNECIQSTLMKKANKIDIDDKANINEVMSQYNKLDQAIKKIEEKSSLALIDNTSIVNMSKRIEEIDQDLDKLIENIGIQFQSLHSVVNTLENTKLNKDQIDKIGLNIPKILSTSPHHYKNSPNALNELRNYFEAIVAKQREEYTIYQKRFENNVNNQFNIIIQDIKTAICDLINQKETLNSFISKSQKDKDKEGYQQLKQMVNGLNKDYSLLKAKIDEYTTKEVEKYKGCINELNNKVNVNDIDEIIKNYIQLLKSDFKEELKQTILSEVTRLINHNDTHINKGINSNSLALSSDEILNMIDSINNTINQKGNIKEILSLLKNKAEVDEVNTALVAIHEELDNKISNDQFSEAIDSQAMLNEVLCAENIIGRWHWMGGKIKNGFLIPFERQSVNTASDNFIWEKDKSSILVVMPGIYEVILGFYSCKKPTVQLMINDESILSAVGSGSVLKYGLKESKGYIAGLTMVEYLLLSDDSKVSISFIGDENSEGFLGLKKL